MGSRAARFKLYAEAYFRFQKAVALDPANAKYVNNLAVLAESQGHFEEAVQLYEKALSLAPKNRRIKENYEKLQAYLKPRAAKPPA
jgi:Flp pilus assembly protein TadD